MIVLFTMQILGQFPMRYGGILFFEPITKTNKKKIEIRIDSNLQQQLSVKTVQQKAR